MNRKPDSTWMDLALDRALSPEQQAQFEQWLEANSEARAAWEALKAADQFLRAAPMAQPRRGFAGRFQARLAQQRSRARAVWGTFALSLGTLGAAAIVAPMGLGMLVPLVQAAQQPAAAAALLSGFDATASFAAILAEALLVTLGALGEWALFSPLAWAAALGALALTGVWLYLLVKLTPKVRFV